MANRFVYGEEKSEPSQIPATPKEFLTLSPLAQDARENSYDPIIVEMAAESPSGLFQKTSQSLRGAE